MLRVQNHHPRATNDAKSYEEDYEHYARQLEKKALKKNLKKVGMHKEHDKGEGRMMRVAFSF